MSDNFKKLRIRVISLSPLFKMTCMLLNFVTNRKTITTQYTIQKALQSYTFELNFVTKRQFYLLHLSILGFDIINNLNCRIKTIV